MATQGSEFLARPDVAQGLDKLFDSCFANLAQDGTPGQMPDVRTFLQEQGVEVSPDFKLELQHSATDAGEDADAVQPLAPICDEQGTKARTECRRVNGKLVCFWVCP